jgi:hypothetical protein
MFADGISYRGVTKSLFVPAGVKINSDIYINTILKPMFEEDIPALYGEDLDKVVFHHDNAPAHQSAVTQDWLASSGIKFIPKEDWMGISPDLAPMDNGINGIFKRNLFNRKPRTLAGLKTVMLDEWSKLSIVIIRKTLRAWSGRVKLMLENHGYQIEHGRK